MIKHISNVIPTTILQFRRLLGVTVREFNYNAIHPSESDIEKLLKQANPDGDDQITLEEFINFVKVRTPCEMDIER